VKVVEGEKKIGKAGREADKNVKKGQLNSVKKREQGRCGMD